MTMKFRETLADLKRLLKNNGIVGSWEKEPNGVHMMRSPDGANLHWASGNGSLWIDGKGTAVRTLMRELAAILHARSAP